MPPISRSDVFRLLLYLVAVFLVAFVFVCVGFWMRMEDDVYIYMRFARNLVASGEVAFNSGQPLVAFTSWLHLGLVAALSLAGRFLPEAVFVSGAILHGLMCAAFVAFAWVSVPALRRGVCPTIVLSALALGCDHLLLATIGMETGWMALGVVVCWTLYLSSREMWALCLSAALVLVRPDGALLGPVLLVDYVWRRRALPWPVLACFAGSCMLLLGLDFWATGHFLPATLDAKLAQGASGHFGRRFLGKLVTGGFPRHERQVWYYLFLGSLVCVHLWDAAMQKSGRRLPLIAVWAAVYFGAYSLLGVPYIYHWYYAPLVLAVYLMAVQGTGVLMKVAGTRPVRRVSVLLWGAFAAWMCVSVLRDPHIESRHRITASYREAAGFIRREVPPGDVVAMAEVGVVGFCIENRVRDLAGIMTPRVADALREGRLDAAFVPDAPAYVLVHDPPLGIEASAVHGEIARSYREVFRGELPGGAMGRVRVLCLVRLDVR